MIPGYGPATYSLFYHYENDHTPFYGVFSSLEGAQKNVPAVWLSLDQYKALNMETREFFYIVKGYMDNGYISASGGSWDFPEAVGLSTNNSLSQGRALVDLAKRIMDSQER